MSVAGVKTGVAETFSSMGKDGTATTFTTIKDTSSSTASLSFEPNDPRLSSSECLKNAAGLAVDSTSAVLSQTVYEVTRIEKQYVELVNVLVLLMEYQLQVLGHKAEEERMADLILETRHEINKVFKRKQDLELLFASAVKLADATAEVAFAAGATYASTSAGERLHSAQLEVERVQASSQAAERNLQQAEVKNIEVMTKHEEKEEKRLKEAEERAKELEIAVEVAEKEQASDTTFGEEAGGGNTEDKTETDKTNEDTGQKYF